MSAERAKPPLSKCRHRVLCVDDAETALSLRAHILEMNGYEVTTFANAVQVVEEFQSGKYDLAILDYEMPVMNGAELAAQLKTAGPDLKIILYTGSTCLEKHDLRFIDQAVHKSDGVPALLAAIKTFLPMSRRNAGKSNHCALEDGVLDDEQIKKT
jgi:CheY-like chemotaxis protein